jgi:hypothetical protein
MNFLLFLMLVVMPSIFGQTSPAKPAMYDVRIDSQRPFVYLLPVPGTEERGPKHAEASPEIYLQFVNNSRMPITVKGYLKPGDSGKKFSGLEDEVVENRPPKGPESAGSIALISEEAKSYPDLIDNPNEHEAEQREAVRRALQSKTSSSNRPRGYNGGSRPGIEVLILVRPGERIDFSLPANHLGVDWHVEVPFRFALSQGGGGRQPYSYVPLFLEDVPAQMREPLRN